MRAIEDVLLRHGARLDEKNNDGRTPLDLVLDPLSQITCCLETPQEVRGPRLHMMSKSKPPKSEGRQACEKLRLPSPSVRRITRPILPRRLERPSMRYFTERSCSIPLFVLSAITPKFYYVQMVPYSYEQRKLVRFLSLCKTRSKQSGHIDDTDGLG